MAGYSGRSQFLNSPSGRALGGLGLGAGLAGTAGTGQFEGDVMSPMIRRKLLNTAALSQIKQINRGDEMDELHSAPDPVYGNQTWRESDVMDYDAEIGARRKAGADLEFKDSMQDYLMPRATERAEAQADTELRGDVRRFYDPANTAMRGDEYSRKLRLATEPSRIAANSRFNTQGLENQGDAQVAAIREQMSPADMMTAISRFIGSGGLGRSRGGQPLGPTGDAASQAQGVVSGFLNGMNPGAGGGAPGGAPGGGGGLTPQEQAFVQDAVRDGYSQEEATAFVMSKRAPGRAAGPGR